MGYKSRQKHLFFDIYGENFKLGGELLYFYKNLSNYDLKLRINTPVDPLKQLLIAGKLNSELVSITCYVYNQIKCLYVFVYEYYVRFPVIICCCV